MTRIPDDPYKPEPVLNEEYWATVISIAWQKATESILETGRLLIEAKGALPHGSWENMVEAGLPFGMNTAQRLMKIASNSVLSNTAHAPLLPPSWMTLYELTKLNEADLQTAIGDGRINPGMERKDVSAIRRAAPETKANNDEATVRVTPGQVSRDKPLAADAEDEQEPKGDAIPDDDDDDPYSDDAKKAEIAALDERIRAAQELGEIDALVAAQAELISVQKEEIAFLDGWVDDLLTEARGKDERVKAQKKTRGRTSGLRCRANAKGALH